jgi:serine-type D-Ala-D-Ala carboxypeptidase (penicillin-binding protein 5/6)
MKTKVLLVAFILSLPFWGAMNALAEKTEGFLYWYQVSSDDYILSADLRQATLEKEIEKARKQNRPVAEELNINARSALSLVIRNGEEKVLFERNSEKIYPFASLAKLMTALVVFDSEEHYSLEDRVVISQEAVDQEGKSKFMPLVAGDEFSVKNLLHIMLLESSNDAAYALAEIMGENNFVEAMNKKARDIGLEKTFFVNVTGLDPDNLSNPINYSTAKDITKLAEYILHNHPDIFKITSLRSWEVVDEKGKTRYFIPENTNELIGEFPEIIGGKTGWTPSAKGCLLVFLKKEGAHYVNIVLGSENRFGDMRTIIKQINGF